MSELDDLITRAEADTGEATPTPAPAAPAKPKESAAAVKEPLPKTDKFIMGFYIVLLVFSVVELYSASSREVTSGKIFEPLIRHMFMLGMGVVICLGVSRLKLKTFVVMTPVFVIVSFLMMLYVLKFGDTINGAKRSFHLAGIMIQPSEFIKISAVLIIAYVMSRNQEKGGVTTRGVVICTIVVAAFGGLLFNQGLTNTLLLMAISLSMMLIGGIQWKKFLMVCLFYGVVGAGGVAYKIFSSDSTHEDEASIVETGLDSEGNKATANRLYIWQARVTRFMDDSIPKYEKPITAENRQEMYAYMAQANGGLIGVFPGNSRETARLPLAFSDYIFSIVVEDTGLVGGMFLLLIYLSLLGRAGTIASRCDRAFPSLLVMGMAVMIVFQALFHMAIVTGVFPVSGQPLPMISKGGTSIMITSLAFGIMLSISRYATMAGRRKAKKMAAADLPEKMAAINLTQLKN